MSQPQKAQNGITSRQLKSIIESAVKAGLQAGHIRAEQCRDNPYKVTEKRLYALPVLRKKVEDDKDRLMRLRTKGAPERSKSITRLSRIGYRAAPEEMLEALILNIEVSIAADEHEIDIIEAALKTIEDDPYYCVVEAKYIQDIADDNQIAVLASCDKSTVYRHRKRLVNRIAVLLYGVAAI